MKRSVLLTLVLSVVAFDQVQGTPPAEVVTSLSSVSPNSFQGSDSERINEAIRVASEKGLSVVVPRRNEARQEELWLLDSAILVRANTTLILDNCHLKLSDRCRDNMIRSANCGLGIADIQPIEHVHIVGLGRAMLEGADHPRATGDSAKTLGKRSYGTDAGKEGVSQTGDWRNIGVLLASVEHFSIENLHIKDSHCWAISLERCGFGRVCDIHFSSEGHMVIDGVRQTTLNQDGLDLRQGCHDINIERLAGHTGDDLLALTNINHASAVAGTDASTMVSAANCREDGLDDIRNIFIRQVAGHSADRHHVVRFLNAGGLKIYNVVLDGLIDTSPPDAPCKATVKIGDANPRWGGVTPVGDTSRFLLSNITSASRHTILIAGSLVDSSISGVIRSLPDGEPVTYESGRDYVENVQMSNIVQRDN